MDLSIGELALPLVHTFTISRGSATVSRTALFRLRWNGLEGLGEASPMPRYGESIESVAAVFRGRDLRGETPYAMERLLADLPPAARCGLDIALHDLVGKDVRRPLWQLLGLDPARTPLTSFTLGIDTLEVTLRKLEAIREHPVDQGEARRGPRDRDDRSDTRALHRHDPHRRERGLERGAKRRDPARTRTLRDRVLRTADPGRHARTTALHSRAREDPARHRRGFEGCKRSRQR